MLQMPGVSDLDSIKKVVGSVAKLEFKLVPNEAGGESQGYSKLKQRSGGTLEVEDEV